MANKNQKPRVPYVKAQIDRLVDDPNSKTRAYVSATIGGAFAIHGIRVVESDKGRFMAIHSMLNTSTLFQRKDIRHLTRLSPPPMKMKFHRLKIPILKSLTMTLRT